MQQAPALLHLFCFGARRFRDSLLLYRRRDKLHPAGEGTGVLILFSGIEV